MMLVKANLPSTSWVNAFSQKRNAIKSQVYLKIADGFRFFSLILNFRDTELVYIIKNIFEDWWLP